MAPRRIVLFVLLVAAACSRPAAPTLGAPGSLRGATVLLVTIDTLRQDRVGVYGNRSGVTPTLDRLAAAGVRFSHAFTPAPLTLPAHASILSGLSPNGHGIHNNTRFRLDAAVPTLATLLKGAGYRTGAFVGAFVLDGRFGLNHGFDVYDDRLAHGNTASFHFAERRAADVVKLAGDWILNRQSTNPQSAINQQSAISNGSRGSISSIPTLRMRRRRTTALAVRRTTRRWRMPTPCSVNWWRDSTRPERSPAR